MKVSKVRNVKTPNRGTKTSSGIDFFVPVFDEKFINDLNIKNGKIAFSRRDDKTVIVLYPQERILIPSGIHINLSTVEGFPIKGKIGVDFVAHNKSGIGSKKGLDLLASVVDLDYQGEIHINVVNTGKNSIEIEENEKLIQFILRPVIYDDVEEVDFSNLYQESTDRGAKGFGEGTGK
jgi:dUTP pyrophosphatase